MNRIIFHIDMNSYFASVAQQMNPLLRGKPIGVGGKPGTRGIIAAASREAKKRGVKTAMSAYEALRICPELIIVDGDMDAVTETTNRFLDIFRRYSDEVEVFSVDEAFLDVTDWCRRYAIETCNTQHETLISGAIRMARMIKADMRRELGEYITCSIGIAPNKLLAKLASDLQKPDGIVVLSRKNPSTPPPSGVAQGIFSIYPERSRRTTDDIRFETFDTLARTLPLTDLCGIAERLRVRLERLDITTIEGLGRAPIGALIDEFGPVMGTKLHLMGNGEDPSPVISVVDSPKSFGHSYTMPTDIIDRDILRTTLYTLAEKVARRMRREGFSGRHIAAYVRYHDFTGAGDGLMRKTYTDDGLEIFRACWRLAKPLVGIRPARLLGIHVSEIARRGQIPLFPADRRRVALIDAADSINNRYGERTIEPLTTLGMTLKRHVSGFHHALPVNITRIDKSNANLQVCE